MESTKDGLCFDKKKYKNIWHIKYTNKTCQEVRAKELYLKTETYFETSLTSAMDLFYEKPFAIFVEKASS